MTTSIVLETSKGNMDIAGLLGALLLALSLLLVGLASLVETRRQLVKVALAGEGLPEPHPFGSTMTKSCSVSKNGVDLLKGVDVNLAPGTVTAVLGESGAGKTTLLRSLAGLETDDVVCGPRACVYVQQQPVVFSSTVGSELMLPKRWFPDLPSSATGYARLFGLAEKADQSTVDLSGGERQRLVLARQLSLVPSLLLLDECTANLGWMHVKTIEDELLRLKKGGVCIVLATHSISQARRLADHILVLKDGAAVPHDDEYARQMLTRVGGQRN